MTRVGKVFTFISRHQIKLFMTVIFACMLFLFPDQAITQDPEITGAKHKTAVSWSVPEALLSEAGVGIVGPSLAADPDGAWHLSYTRYENSRRPGVGTYTHIMYMNEDAEPIVLSTAYNSGSGGTVIDQPSLATDADGAVHLVFQRTYYSYYGQPESMAFFYMNNALGFWSLPENVFSGSGEHYSSPALAIDQAGDWHIVFREYNDYYTTKMSRIRYMYRWNPNPVVLAEAFMSGSGGTVLSYPCAAAGAETGIHVAFEKVDYNVYGPVLATAMYTQNTLGAWANPEPILSVPKAAFLHPTLTADGWDRWHLAYCQNEFMLPDTYTYIKYLTPDCVPVTLAKAHHSGSGGYVLDFPSISTYVNNQPVHLVFQEFFSHVLGQPEETSIMYMKSNP
jgi:hypothetical protein